MRENLETNRIQQVIFSKPTISAHFEQRLAQSEFFRILYKRIVGEKTPQKSCSQPWPSALFDARGLKLEIFENLCFKNRKKMKWNTTKLLF